jgi:spore coat protein U domain-containing protein, fimbrial subunit CupE1/2/3/6
LANRSLGTWLRLTLGSLLTIGGLAVATGAAIPAQAFGTATGNLTVTAGIGTSCTVSNVGINFGTVTTTSAVTTSGSLNVNCSSGLPYNLDLDLGLNPTAPPTTRQLSNGANRLAYNIYTTNTYITVWGSGMTGGTSQSFIGTGANQYIQAYLKIPVQAAPPNGLYTDTVTITAIF